jgi:hypothetical protein
MRLRWKMRDPDCAVLTPTARMPQLLAPSVYGTTHLSGDAVSLARLGPDPRRGLVRPGAASTRRVGNHNLTVYGSEFIDRYAETRSMDNIDQWGAYGLEGIF